MRGCLVFLVALCLTLTALPAMAEDVAAPMVYMTRDISPEGLMAVYQALGREAAGENVAVKISTGETGSNYLRVELIGDFVKSVNGTIVENNTAYGGQRASTAMHKQLAADHGYTSIANVDILDEDGSMTLPVKYGVRLTENYIGSHTANYDFLVVLSHFTYQAAIAKNPDAKPLFHSDRGFQYTSSVFQQRLKDAGMEQSMSRVGHCIDNGPTEGLWGIVKAEMYDLQKFESEESLLRAIDQFIAYYNQARYQARFGFKAPLEVRAAAQGQESPVQYPIAENRRIKAYKARYTA